MYSREHHPKLVVLLVYSREVGIGCNLVDATPRKPALLGEGIAVRGSGAKKSQINCIQQSRSSIFVLRLCIPELRERNYPKVSPFASNSKQRTYLITQIIISMSHQAAHNSQRAVHVHYIPGQRTKGACHLTR